MRTARISAFAFAFATLTLTGPLVATAHAQQWIQLDLSINNYGPPPECDPFCGFGPELMNGFTARVVFDPNSPVVLDNGVNARRWEVIEVSVCGVPVTSYHRIQATGIPSLNYSTVSLTGQFEIPGSDPVDTGGSWAIVWGMDYGDPWPIDSGGWNEYPGGLSFSVSPPQLPNFCWNPSSNFSGAWHIDNGYSFEVAYIPAGQTADVGEAIPAHGPGLQAFPNPFNPRGQLQFDLPAASDVTLTVRDVQGRLVRTLVQGRREAGHHELEWDGLDDGGRAAASGVYLVEMRAGGKQTSRKVTLAR